MRAVRERTYSSTSAFFFCGIRLLGEANESVTSIIANSWLDQTYRSWLSRPMMVISPASAAAVSVT